VVNDHQRNEVNEMEQIKKCAEQIDTILKEYNATLVAEILVGNGYSKAVVRIVPVPEQPEEEAQVIEEESK
jgi:hypothetical protein